MLPVGHAALASRTNACDGVSAGAVDAGAVTVTAGLGGAAAGVPQAASPSPATSAIPATIALLMILLMSVPPRLIARSLAVVVRGRVILRLLLQLVLAEQLGNGCGATAGTL